VVTAGFTATLSAPWSSALTVPTGCQSVPSSCWRTASATPRAMPVRRAREPYTTGPLGALRDRTPTLNHVDRSPRRVRRSLPGTATEPFVPTTFSVLIRPDEFNSGCRSVIRPGSFSFFASCAPVNENGPQSWYGEIESYGSGTERRYGTGLLQTDDVDRAQLPVRDVDLDRTAPGMLDRQWSCTGLEQQRPGQRTSGLLSVGLQLQRRGERVRAGGDRVDHPGGVAHTEVRGR